MSDPDFPPLANAESDVDASFDDTPVDGAVEACHPQTRDPSQTDWVEIVLVDDFDQPIANERFRLTLPDGKVIEGKTGEDGSVRADGIATGDCEIVYPDLEDALEAAEQTSEPADDEDDAEAS